MSTKNRQGPPDPGEGPVIPPDKPLAETMEELSEHTLVETGPAATPKRVVTKELIEEIKNKYGVTLTEVRPFGELKGVISRSHRLWAYRIGAVPGLKHLRQPDQAKTLLLPAVDAVFEAAPVLWVEARAVLEGLDLDQAQIKRERLVQVRELIEDGQEFVELLQALESNLEQDLDGMARTVQERSESLVTTNRTIKKMLKPLTALVVQSAEEAAETKKKLARALEEKGAAAAKPAPEGPATPTPDEPAAKKK
jgi:hypothetical protein